MFANRLRLAASSAVALFSVFAVTTTVASAHAQYSGSTPAAGATVSDLPAVLQITYTQELSDIQIAVTGPDGSNVTTGPARFDLANRHNTSVPLRSAGPGSYTVVWHNVSGDDGDPNDGSFAFSVVAPAGGQVTNPPAAADNAQPAASGQAAAATCVENGKKTPGINDIRVDTYCKRQAIREKFKGQIDEATFNGALADGEGLESALADAMADFQQEQKSHH
jgi:methionine-rich copper-binding protein CopC